ncbi:hypothetical protein AFL22_00385 [Pantoea sp. CFSAN033090]|nr:hypothetical protein AFL22_00385 [Pantoea sp. CFSAN033090]
MISMTLRRASYPGFPWYCEGGEIDKEQLSLCSSIFSDMEGPTICFMQAFIMRRGYENFPPYPYCFTDCCLSRINTDYIRGLRLFFLLK